MNNNLNINEFKVFGIKIENISVFYGSFLIFWGVIVSFMSGSNSFTSFIPSIIGLPILIFSYLSIKFEKINIGNPIKDVINDVKESLPLTKLTSTPQKIKNEP